jgi:hypothetical protein
VRSTPNEPEDEIAKMVRFAEAALGEAAPRETPSDFNAEEVAAMFRTGEFSATWRLPR